LADRSRLGHLLRRQKQTPGIVIAVMVKASTANFPVGYLCLFDFLAFLGL
jgi:hypothetical protein